MKGKFIAFASILCIASLMASGAYADKPAKPGKPEKPGNTQTEWIAFTGDIEGGAHVEGCCPNAGPNPLFTFTLKFDLVDEFGQPIFDDWGNQMYKAGTYTDGYLFMNGWSDRKAGESGYLVQFWHSDCEDCNPPESEPLTFEIICGETAYDRKTRVLNVTCDEVAWWKDYNRGTDMGPLLSFEILRVPTRYCTDDICGPLP